MMSTRRITDLLFLYVAEYYRWNGYISHCSKNASSFYPNFIEGKKSAFRITCCKVEARRCSVRQANA